MKDPYSVIKSRYITEKATTLEQLQNAESNRSVERFKSPKYVFIVDRHANKHEIALAVEMIYKEKNVKVTKVNTLHTKRKMKRRGRGKAGMTSSYKKAIVTMEPGDVIEQV
ncbi:MAG: 50S ribosomal protein L23 [Chlamydiales bacterium]|nr:50S ribosomal protein L23 [Chlamydiales bacterium]